eukprot:m.182329 g.182329  ORF g.182329 m.182329 type:complete len:581 (+) comp32109_c0_seq2:259-2001(+)
MVHPICGHHFESGSNATTMSDLPPTSKTNFFSFDMMPDSTNPVPPHQPQSTINIDVVDPNDTTTSIPLLPPPLSIPLPHSLGFPEERMFDDMNANVAFGIHTGEFGGPSAVAALPDVLFNTDSESFESSLHQSPHRHPQLVVQPRDEAAAHLMDTSDSADDEIELIDTTPASTRCSSCSSAIPNTSPNTSPTHPHRLQPLENKSLTELASEFGFELTNFDPTCVDQHDTEFQQLLSAFWHHPNLETPKILPDSRSERSLVLPQMKPTNADLLSLPAFGINPNSNPNRNFNSVALRPKRRWDGCELTAAARALKSPNSSSTSSSSVSASSTTSLTVSSSCSCSTVSVSCSCSCSSVADTNHNSVAIIEDDEVDNDVFTINTNTADCLDITEEELWEFIETTSPPSPTPSSTTTATSSSESSLSIPSSSTSTTKQTLTSRYAKFLTLGPQEIAKCIEAFAAHELAHIDFKLLSKLMQRAGFSTQQIRELKAMRKMFKNRESAIKTLEKRRSQLSYATGMNKKLGQMVRSLHTQNQTLTRQNKQLQHEQTVARDQRSHCGSECSRLKHRIHELSARVSKLSQN